MLTGDSLVTRKMSGSTSKLAEGNQLFHRDIQVNPV
jgi:hypothetical protein